jgi:hypothetical protein
LRITAPRHLFPSRGDDCLQRIRILPSTGSGPVPALGKERSGPPGQAVAAHVNTSRRDFLLLLPGLANAAASARKQHPESAWRWSRSRLSRRPLRGSTGSTKERSALALERVVAQGEAPIGAYSHGSPATLGCFHVLPNWRTSSRRSELRTCWSERCSSLQTRKSQRFKSSSAHHESAGQKACGFFFGSVESPTRWQRGGTPARASGVRCLPPGCVAAHSD